VHAGGDSLAHLAAPSSCEPVAGGPIATCVTPDLLLQHLDETLATYVRKQLKHLEHTSETPVKHLKKHLKAIVNACNIQIYFYNIQIKHLQHTYEILKTNTCNMHVMQHIQIYFCNV
jgi:hypothetical protein